MNDIDFVVTWVDGNDANWQKEKAKYSGVENGDARVKRYREWDLLPYWFRGVEKYAPWVNKIHFVTYGHLPPWLNISNPKLNIVNHSDYIPAKYLPTFSCRPIELNLHRIPGLSENFVYFNDDMYLLRPVSESDFFRNGLPCDTAILQATCLHGVDENKRPLKPEEYNTSNVYNIPPINRNFNKKQSIKRNIGKWFSPNYGTQSIRTLLLLPWGDFSGFVSPHLPYSYNKKTFQEVWEKEEFLLDRACKHKFRDSSDVSSRLFSFWQLAAGNFYPRSLDLGKYFGIIDDKNRIETICSTVKEKKYKIICLNDEYSGDEFEYVKQQIINSFATVFPEKSSFEK